MENNLNEVPVDTTDELMQGVNGERLTQSIQQLKDGKTTAHNLDEVIVDESENNLNE